MSQTSQRDLKAILRRVRGRRGNTSCFDCRTNNPNWCSIYHGIWVCLKCSGIHRELGTHLCRVKSPTLDDWTEEYVHYMKIGGNGRARKFFRKMGIDPLPLRQKYKTSAAKQYKSTLKREVTAKLGRSVGGIEVVMSPTTGTPRAETVYTSSPSSARSASPSAPSDSLSVPSLRKSHSTGDVDTSPPTSPSSASASASSPSTHSHSARNRNRRNLTSTSPTLASSWDDDFVEEEDDDLVVVTNVTRAARPSVRVKKTNRITRPLSTPPRSPSHSVSVSPAPIPTITLEQEDDEEPAEEEVSDDDDDEDDEMGTGGGGGGGGWDWDGDDNDNDSGNDFSDQDEDEDDDDGWEDWDVDGTSTNSNSNTNTRKKKKGIKARSARVRSSRERRATTSDVDMLRNKYRQQTYDDIQASSSSSSSRYQGISSHEFRGNSNGNDVESSGDGISSGSSSSRYVGVSSRGGDSSALRTGLNPQRRFRDMSQEEIADYLKDQASVVRDQAMQYGKKALSTASDLADVASTNLKRWWRDFMREDQ